MNALLNLQILGWLLVGLGGIQWLPIGTAAYYGEPVLPYVASSVTALVFGLALALSARSPDRRLRVRDGFFVVSASWVLASLFGALPYITSDVLSPVDALFESAAGFSTTGSSVMTDVESAPRGLLLWRSLTQWLGGMGIIVLAVAVFPLLGIGGMQLFRAEVPGPVADKLTPRVASTARRLWAVYLLFTAAAFLSLRVAGLESFDAVCHALTTLATGGFSTRNASVGAFGLPAVEWTVTFFMLLAGVNFVLHYRLLTGRVRGVADDAELRFYLGTIAVLVLGVAWLLQAQEPEGALRTAAFQIISILTTTGYAVTNYELWPALGQFVILPLLFLGGMTGSTTGGLKTLRVLLGLRALRIVVARSVHPRAVLSVRYAGRPVPDDIMSGIGVFFIAYATIALAGAMVVASAGYDVETSISAVLTALGNVGPGLGRVGPTDTFAHFPAYVKLALSFCMIAGRLELFTLLVVVSPTFWRR